MAKESKYSSDIIFVDYVAVEDLNAFYSASDLFVFPSLNEGFGLPVVESMASGTPVITSNVTALPEVGGDVAVLVNPLDIKEISIKMASLLLDKEKLEDLSKKGIIKAQNFVWSKTSKETVDLYLKLLNL
jgi:glycosyltransferase involved in cell wall biosynthesis